ncbi:MAG: PIG-L family deacetylase [Acidobacteria bacterium]|nr:MAG: PIG-L family deacetylase [Acidobacteriota bacterium]
MRVVPKWDGVLHADASLSRCADSRGEVVRYTWSVCILIKERRRCLAESITRRAWLRRSSRLAGAVTTGLPLVGSGGGQTPAARQRKLKLVAVGAHVDDPQSGCGGTMALYANLGHEVVALSLTHGDSESIASELRMPPNELAAKRSADAVRSCAILKGRMIFLDQINLGWYEKFGQILLAERPDVVFTHWPIDTHPDHRAASLLTYDAWLRSGRKFALYFYEVELGQQTQIFRPNHYVDITQVENQKREACFANTITIQGWWPLHEAMQRFRGMECGGKVAEAFIHHVESPHVDISEKGS